MLLQGLDQVGEFPVAPGWRCWGAGIVPPVCCGADLCRIEDVIESADARSELRNGSGADMPLMGSLISKKGAEVGEKSNRSFVKGTAFVAKAGAQILKRTEVAGEAAYLEFVLVGEMVPHKANHNDVRMVFRLGEIGIIEIVPIPGRSGHRSNLKDAARSGKSGRNIFLQQGLIDSMEKEGIPEDHDAWTCATLHFLRNFRESMNVNTIVIEGGSEDARDDFEQKHGARQNSEDFPLGAFKTGSR